jgi:hypothetical protein
MWRRNQDLGVQFTDRSWALTSPQRTRAPEWVS